MTDLGLCCTGSKWPDGYYTEEGRKDLRSFVKETIKDWEEHSEKLAAAREAARKGRELLSLPVRHACFACFRSDI